MKQDAKNILEVIRTSRSKVLSGREIAAELDLPNGAKRHFHRQLRELERQGLLKRVRGGRYSLAKEAAVKEGVVSLNRRGDGWLVLENGESVRIPARYLTGAREGDRVKIAVMRKDRMNRLNGRVMEIVERSVKPVVGVFQRGRDENIVLPIDPAIRQPILVANDEKFDLTPGDWVVVKPFAGQQRNSPARADVIEILGDPADPKVEIKAVASRFSIPLHFSSAVVTEAGALAEKVTPDDLVGRKDLRELPFITIDGETARDFDDAVMLRQEGEFYRLLVAIADVSHYVTTGSALDQSALERGTSTYFPGFCIPMLPEKLSNEICSLKPEVDRLVMIAEMQFDQMGQRLQSSFYPGIIRSRARMTYTAVQALLDEPGLSGADEHFAQLPHMLACSIQLTRRRMERGSLDFEIPEPEVVLDPDGRPEIIHTARRLAAHRIIEEFMLAANEAVAEFLGRQRRDLLYRIHEPPDPSGFSVLNHYLVTHSLKALTFNHDLHPEMQQLINAIEDPAEKKIISRLLLQNMKQARYSVVNEGHYGLAAEHYCHFTSPIRRYPDLVVHRILKECLLGASPSRTKSELSGMADISSQRERIAVDAERDVQAMISCRFMEDKVGEQYSAKISSVQKFGLFVELDDFPIEGLVHISRLDDYYHYNGETGQLVGEKSGNTYAIGMTIKVLLENVNIWKREIDFTLLPDRSKENNKPVHSGRKRRKSWR